MTLRISEIIFERFITPLYWNDFIFERSKYGREHKECLNTLLSFTGRVIKERDVELKHENYNIGGTQKRVAFLDMLLKAKQEDSTITYEDIQEGCLK